MQRISNKIFSLISYSNKLAVTTLFAGLDIGHHFHLDHEPRYLLVDLGWLISRCYFALSTEIDFDLYRWSLRLSKLALGNLNEQILLLWLEKFGWASRVVIFQTRWQRDHSWATTFGVTSLLLQNDIMRHYGMFFWCFVSFPIHLLFRY